MKSHYSSSSALDCQLIAMSYNSQLSQYSLTERCSILARVGSNIGSIVRVVITWCTYKVHYDLPNSRAHWPIEVSTHASRQESSNALQFPPQLPFYITVGSVTTGLERGRLLLARFAGSFRSQVQTGYSNQSQCSFLVYDVVQAATTGSWDP